MCMLAQHRGGACFCTRDGVLNFSFRYEVFGVGKNRDTKVGAPAPAGQPVPPLQIGDVAAKFSRHRSQLHIPTCYAVVLFTKF